MSLRFHLLTASQLAPCFVLALTLSLVVLLLLPFTGSVWASDQPPGAADHMADPARAHGGQGEGRELLLGAPVERELAGGEEHSYRIELTSGKYAHVTIDQRGIDVVVAIFGPDGNLLTEVDRPNGSRGPEGVSLVARATGTYLLRIRSLEGGSARGKYRIGVDDLRDAVARDESRMLAEKAVTEGERLRAQGTAESLSKASQRFREALALWRALNDEYEQAVVLYGLGLAERETGEYQKAVVDFREGLSLMRNAGDRYGEAVAQTGLAWALLYLSNNQQALDNFAEALSIRRAIDDRLGQAFEMYGIGWAHELMGENQEALDSFFESLRIRRDIGDRRGGALTLSGIGNIYYRIGRNSEALEYLSKALLVSREQKDIRGEANTLSGLGWVYSSLGQNEKALEYFFESFSLRRKIGDRAGEATTLYGIAKVESQRGDLTKARSYAEPALKIIESLRSEGLSQQLRISYFASVQEYYEFYIDQLMQLDRLCPAEGFAYAGLEVSERARARGLLDLLAEAHIDLRRGVDKGLLERERSLHDRLNVAADRQQQLLGRAHTRDQAAAAAREVEALTTQYDEVVAQIRRSSPQYGALMQPEPLGLPEIQRQVLDADTVLLEYALGESRSYVWAVTRTTVNSAVLPGRAEIEAGARRVYELLTARNHYVAEESSEQRRARVAQADAEYPHAAAAVSQMLLRPVAQALETRRLVVVAQGALELIPFAALPVPALNSSSSGNRAAKNGQPTEEQYKPLIAEHEVVNVPSASALAGLRLEVAGREPASKAVCVIADPVFSRGDERVLRSAEAHNERFVNATGNLAGSQTDRVAGERGAASGKIDFGGCLPRLFNTRWEAKQITSLVPAGQAMMALDFAASRSTATSPELRHYRVIHFATHALVNDEHPELSGIALSALDGRGDVQEGFLRLHEIPDLRLHAELVVLSACRTALGKDLRGEGLLGMTRGFMYAGVPRVVVSLWSVNDRASAEVMARFYKRMFGSEHLSPSAALRAAELELAGRERWVAPYFWAAFVLQGEWR